MLRNSGNDNTKTLFADLLMHKLAEGLPVLTQNGYAVNVCLNGNYWGIAAGINDSSSDHPVIHANFGE